MAPPPQDPRSPARPAVLPAALGRALDTVPPGPRRERLASLFEAAAAAIQALGELDLGRWESEEIGHADLSVWESLAPFVHDTFLQVQAFLDAVGARAPEAGESPEPDLDGAFDELVSGAPPRHPASDRLEASTEAVIGDIAAALSRELRAFGEGLRRPNVAADRWNLLAHLGEFRGKFRLGIGEMVFLAARHLAPVRKAEVVPFYRQEIDDAVLLRRAFVLVGLSVRADHEGSRDAGPGARLEAARRILSQLDVFVGSRPWRLVRADDKRALFEARRSLADLVAGRGAPGRLPAALEGLDKFLGSLLVINRRETLIGHDREALAAVARRLERARTALDLDDGARARADLAVALSTAQRLLGRDPSLDALLLSLRRVDPTGLDDAASRRLVATLDERIAGVPRF